LAAGLFAILAGLVLCIGLFTPFVASILTIGYLIESVSPFVVNDTGRHADTLAALNLAAMSLALALLGPGAFSIDARLFGRLEIIIPESRRPPR
jgi:uncharacterized membrane protein YphA (DoxX/SURF4 family)